MGLLRNKSRKKNWHNLYPRLKKYFKEQLCTFLKKNNTDSSYNINQWHLLTYVFFINNPMRMWHVLLRSVTLIIISTIDAISISDKVRFTEAATGANHVFKNISIFTGNTSVGVSFIIKLQALSPAALLKRDFNTGIFLWILLNFQNIYFEEHLPTAASKFCVTALISN